MAWLCGWCADLRLAAAVDWEEDQLKFRNPETGKIFHSSASLWGQILFDIKKMTPYEAARLMGYEVVEEMWEPQLNEGEMEKNHFSTICGFQDPKDANKDQQAKADAGKPRPTLTPVSLIDAVTAVRMYGNAKYYGPENWRQVEPQRYRDALYRHWLAYLKGEKCDQESGLPHLWHLACNAAFLIEMEGSIHDGEGSND